MLYASLVVSMIFASHYVRAQQADLAAAGFSTLVGKTIALWNPTHKRFVRMPDGTNMDKSPERADGTLPAGWAWEMFKVVDSGDGTIALWNPTHKRFMRMNRGVNLDKSAERADGTLGDNWTWEVFNVVNVDKGLIALWSPLYKRFVRMPKGDLMDKSRKRPDGTLGDNWTWEIFKVVDAGKSECVSEQKAAGELGFTQVTWDKTSPEEKQPDSINEYWVDLTDSERAAAVILGYNATTWNNESGSEPKPASASKGWDQLTTCEETITSKPASTSPGFGGCVSEQKAAGELGFTQVTWGKTSPKEKQPDSINEYWVDLTESEKAAAVILGYNATTWNNESGSEPKPASASKGWDQLTTCGSIYDELTQATTTTTTTTQEGRPSDEFQVFLNEVHAGNSSDHVQEGVEVVGPANTNLTGWTILKLLVQLDYIEAGEGPSQLQMGMQEDGLYAEQLQTRMQEARAGGGARAGGVFPLGGILDDEGNGFGAKWFDLELEYDLDPIVTKVMYLMDPTGKSRDAVAYSGPGFQQLFGKDYPRTWGNLTWQRTGIGRTIFDFPWAKVLGPSSRGRINDGQTFNRIVDGDVAEGSYVFFTVIMVLVLVMTIAVLTIVVALVMGAMHRRSQTKTERPVDCEPPTVAVPKQKRINKFLSDRAVSDRSISFARRMSQAQSALASDPRFQLNPKFLTEVKRNMQADYGVVLTEDIGVPRGLQERTLKNSNFRAIYKSVMQAGVPTRPAQLLLAAEKLVKLYAESCLSTNQQKLEKFLSKLNAEAFGNQCRQKRDTIGCFAEFMWTSTNTLEGKEFSNILNQAIRGDRPEFLLHAIPLVCGINRLRRIRRDHPSRVDKAFPPNGVSWRGTGFREEFKPFYTVGARFRIPAFYATSFSQKAYVRNTFVKGEGEYLFAPYSVFTVERVCWSKSLEDPHVLHLTVVA